MNNRRFSPAAKLLLSFIDTVAYLESGDEPRNFQRWLDTYAEMNNVGVTSDELWEFRNAILHTTSGHSRKVKLGQHPALTLYIGQIHPRHIPQNDRYKPLGLWQLFEELCHALEKWSNSFNEQPSKFRLFVERYDQVVSDSRYLEFEIDPEQLNSLIGDLSE